MHCFKLRNPFGEQPAIFEWQENSKVPSDDSNEIFQIIKLLSEDHTELKLILKRYIDTKKNDVNNHNYYLKLKVLCDEFNEWAKQFSESRVKTDQENSDKKCQLTTVTKTQIRYIMHLTYNRSVTNPDKLNDYEPFSPQVYGETSFDLIDEMLKRVNLSEKDVFVDLGSGVGNVVLHVAAVTQCKRCYGFEKAHWPAFYADRMKNEFKFWMNFFGKRYSDFRLYKGDFLSDEEYIEPDELSEKRKLTMNDYVKEIINEANLIFVNNYAFGAEVDHQLKLRFCNMLEGSIIVSSKPFCPLNFRINSRNLNDIGTILNVTEYEPISGRVSWTDRPITYYFHKLDRTLLEKYFERLKNPSKSKEENHLEKKKSPSPNSGSNSSSCSPSAHTSHSPSNHESNKDENSRIRGRSRRRTVDTDDVNSVKSSSLKETIAQGDEHDQSSRLKKKKKKRKSSATSLKRADSTNPSKVEKRAKKTHKSPSTGQRQSRSKSLDKDLLKTLEKMHTEVVKSSQATNAQLETKPKNTETVSATNVKTKTNTKTTSQNLNDSTNTTAQLSEFNLKTMTNLTNENLDKRLLKDCHISSKLFDNNGKLDSGESFPEELMARKELGDDIVNALDTYLMKCKRQYLKYLLHLNSNEYKKSIMTDIDKEEQIKNELLNRKEKLEQQTSNLLKSNVSLLKMRAAELGIKDLKSPYELIQCAQDILNNHQMIMNKINTLQSTVNKLELRTTINNSIQTNTKSNKEETTHKHTKTSSNKLNNSKDDLFVSRKSNQKDVNHKLDMLMGSVRTESTSTLKNFKIPKKEFDMSSTSSLANQQKASVGRNITPPGSPSSTSTSSSHSSSSNVSKNKHINYEQQNTLLPTNEMTTFRNNEMQFLPERSNSIELSRQTSCDSPVSSSSSSSLTNTNLNSDGAYQNSKSYPNYYHPKKNQFRQYMMESNSSAKSSLFNKESYPYNEDHTGWSSS